MRTILTSPYFLLFSLTFLFTVIGERILIPQLRRHHAGQPILMDGPGWHIGKSGTPTMGGLGFLLSSLLAVLLYALYAAWQGRVDEAVSLSLLVGFALLNGLIGFLDDLQKLRHRENKGLSAWQKYLLQLVVSAAFLGICQGLELIDTTFVLSVDHVFSLGIFFYPLALLYLTGLINACNLTDGLDGLLSAIICVIGGFFILWGASSKEYLPLAVGVLLLGSSVGFLLFNIHPAKVFMGDTGSLFLGAMVAGLGILSKRPATVFLSAGVPVIEATSVIFQVFFFKITGGRRLFRMAPLHHHFEKCGLTENTIVAIFGAAGVLFAVFAYIWG